MAGSRKADQVPWLSADDTLKRLIGLGYSRPKVAEALSKELKMRVTDDHVTSRAKRIGLALPSLAPQHADKLPPTMRPVRLNSTKLFAFADGVSRARTCQNPLWVDRGDEEYGLFCEDPCDGRSSYCETHRAINYTTVAALLENKVVKNFKHFPT